MLRWWIGAESGKDANPDLVAQTDIEIAVGNELGCYVHGVFRKGVAHERNKTLTECRSRSLCNSKPNVSAKDNAG